MSPQRATTYSVWIEHARRRDLAVLSGPVRAVTVPAEIDAVVAPLCDRLRAAPGATIGRHVAVYRGMAGVPNALRWPQVLPAQVGVECVLPPGGVDGIEATVTPDGLAATTEHIGPLERLPEAHTAVRAWCRTNGWEMDGTSWEVYGRWSGNPNQWHTAVYYLVR